MEEFSRHSLLSSNQYLQIDRSIVSHFSRKRKSESFDIEDASKEEKSEITMKNEKDVSNCKKDYIHVRARRGQATDSHSLAERARREKISMKMKYLQDLVPGCNKVTGKAGMLDEIINYVQSLQKQVEILSLKLATFSPRPKEMIKASAYVECLPSQAVDPTNSSSFYNIMQQLGSSASISHLPPPKPEMLEPFFDSSYMQILGWELD